MPAVSVILPVYNGIPYLAQAVDSVLAQTFRDLELVLVDDGSFDGSEALCDEYAGRDPRVMVVHRENGGLSAARNTGLKHASGEYVSWLDADDWMEPDAIEYLLSAAERAPGAVICCGFTNVNGNACRPRPFPAGSFDSRESLLRLLRFDIPHFMWAKLCRRELYRDIVFPEGCIYEDIAVIYRLMERGGALMLPECKLFHRVLPGSLSHIRSLKHKHDLCRITRERALELLPRYPEWEKELLLPLLQAMQTFAGVAVKQPRKDGLPYRAEMRACAELLRAHRKTLRRSLPLSKRVQLFLLSRGSYTSLCLSALLRKAASPLAGKGKPD